MSRIEKQFDINIILMTLSSSLEMLKEEKQIELVFDMDPTVPKELRGDPAVLQHMLNQMLTFVCQNTDKKEVVLTLSAPEDFVYEEPLSFKIKSTGISREKLQAFLESDLSKDLEKLDGKIVYDKETEIHVDIPFMISELGHRRYYRLPDASMTGKKVLLICESPKVSKSLQKMFKYFLYDVDVGIDRYKAQGNNLASYDILILEDKYNTEELEHVIANIQQSTPLKYILLQGDHYAEYKTISVTTHLIKPVTLESLYELIVSLFKDESDTGELKPNAQEYIVDLEKMLRLHKSDEKHLNPSSRYEENLEAMIEKRRRVDLPVLDTKTGEENATKLGLKYKDELKVFLDTFDKSDIYFRQIVNEQASTKIKEFCIDLEKQAKRIGAESILKVAETVSLIFVYNKLDLLTIYPGKYHLELQKLTKEIKKELNMK